MHTSVNFHIKYSINRTLNTHHEYLLYEIHLLLNDFIT